MPTFGLREPQINTLHAFWRRVAEDGLAIEQNLARYEGVELPSDDPQDDNAKPAPTVLDGSKLIAAELARQKERDQALGTEPRMLSGFSVPAPSQGADDALKQITLIGPGGKTSGQPFPIRVLARPVHSGSSSYQG